VGIFLCFLIPWHNINKSDRWQIYRGEEDEKMQVLGSQELLADVFEKDLCIGCGACVDLCPYFKNYKGKTSQLFPCDLSEGRCYAHCPKAEVNLDELSNQIWGVPYDGSPLGNYRMVLAARAGKKMKDGCFQSGGTVSALITFALDNKLIEAAALTDREGLEPVPRLVASPDEVVTCASSKFMASPTLSTINTAMREGYTRLGVVGTPCQLTAIAQMRANPVNKEDFVDPVALTVGLFCNWSLDTRLFMALLSEKLDIATIQSMEIPPPPANIMVLETDSGKVEIPLSEIKPLIPHTCFICLDMTSEFSDISVGMFEGRPGWNTLIIRSPKGADLVAQASRKGFLDTEDMPQENLEHLARAAAEKKERALRTLLRRELVNNEEGQRSAVRIPQNVVDKILKTK
jgi:coenzyme F420 hydrogenase subunit beta